MRKTGTATETGTLNSARSQTASSEKEKAPSDLKFQPEFPPCGGRSQTNVFLSNLTASYNELAFANQKLLR